VEFDTERNMASGIQPMLPMIASSAHVKHPARHVQHTPVAFEEGLYIFICAKYCKTWTPLVFTVSNSCQAAASAARSRRATRPWNQVSICVNERVELLRWCLFLALLFFHCPPFSTAAASTISDELLCEGSSLHTPSEAHCAGEESLSNRESLRRQGPWKDCSRGSPRYACTSH
jgi:hypothetical protein